MDSNVDSIALLEQGFLKAKELREKGVNKTDAQKDLIQMGIKPEHASMLVSEAFMTVEEKSIQSETKKQQSKSNGITQVVAGLLILFLILPFIFKATREYPGYIHTVLTVLAIPFGMVFLIRGILIIKKLKREGT